MGPETPLTRIRDEFANLATKQMYQMELEGRFPAPVGGVTLRGGFFLRDIIEHGDSARTDRDHCASCHQVS
jgi:hypothetical protein